MKRIGRRHFLQGTGGALMALPALGSLAQAAPGTPAPGTKAEPGVPPLRLFAIKSYSTQRLVDWYPRFSGKGYRARPFDPKRGEADGTTELRQALAEASGRHRDGREYFARYAPLKDLAAGGALSKILGSEFNPYLQELLLLRGLDFMPETSHNDGGMLGNYAGADLKYDSLEAWPTIDQVLAFSRRFYQNVPLGPRSLHLSLSHKNTCSFTHNGVPGAAVTQVAAHTDPQTAFLEVFGALPKAERERRRTLVDRVHDDYRQLSRSEVLSSDDRRVLEQHVALLSELESRLGADPTRTCDLPAEPPSADLVGVEVEAIQRTVRHFLEIALLAIRCDLTRVVTFDVWKAVGRKVGPNGEDLGYAHSSAKDARDWHERVHEFGRPASDQQVCAINQWIAKDVLLPVLAGLSQIEDSEQTYLDRSLVYWGNELGMNHANYSVPALLAGRAGGRLTTGRYLDYIDWHEPVRMTQENAPIIQGVPHNRLLVTLLQAFGLRASDYERSGQTGFGSYTTRGKSRAEYPIDYDASKYGAPLPGILR